MSAYGSLNTTPPPEDVENQTSSSKSWRESLGETLENEKFHYTVLGLTLLDAICVVIQITYTFFHECQVPVVLLSSNEKHNYWLFSFEIAETISIFICVLFMMECLLSLIAFGPKYYLPGWPHWKLHLFDLAVISTTFVLEVGLKGKEREIAGLLIVFRLWRVVKIIEAAVMGVSFAHEEELEQLREDYEKLQAKYKEQVELNQRLTSTQE